MKDNSNHNSVTGHEDFPAGNNFKFIIRLRGKDSSSSLNKTDHSTTKKSISKLKSKSPDRLFYPSINSKPKKSQVHSLPLHHSLNQAAKYSVFTTNPPSNTLVVTSKPISGKLIDLTYKTPRDLYEFSQSILKDSSLLEYDKVYNESSTVNEMYSEYFEERVNDLFQGKDSAVFFFGPTEGGKSYSLRGGATDSEPGLLNKIIEGVFNLIEVSKQSYINDISNELKKSFVVKMQVYQVYQERVSDLIGIEGRMLEEKEIRSIKEYDDILKQAIENRKILAQKLKVSELKRKSSLIVKIHIEKRSRDDNRINIFKFAQMTLIELPSSNYALMTSKEEENKLQNDPSSIGVCYRSTKGMLMNIRDALTSASNGVMPIIECKLLETMPEIFNKSSNGFTFFTCVDPFESSIKSSMKALKYANRLRHLVLNSVENADGDNNKCNYNNSKVMKDSTLYDNSDEEYNAIVQKNQIAKGKNDNRKIINPNASIPFTQANQSQQSVNDSPIIKENKDNRSSQVRNQQNKSKIADQSKASDSYYTQEGRSPCQSQKDFLLQKYRYLVNPMPNQNTSPNISHDNNNTPIRDKIFQDEHSKNIKQCNQYSTINHSIPIERSNSNEYNQNQSQLQLQSDNNTLISDNIILKEDIQRLSLLNNRLSEELEMERRHQAELGNRICQLQSEKEMFENDLKQIIKKQNDLIESEESEDMYTKMNTRLIQERKINKLMNENSTFKLCQNKFETENKILTEHLNELKSNYNRLNDEFRLEQMNHNKGIEQIESKIETLTNEIYNLQSENKYLRASEEKARHDCDKAMKERDDFKEKYLKHKERSVALQSQMQVSASQIQQYTIESKLKQNMLEENQKTKYDTKAKIVSDLKSKIDNFRSMTYQKRSNESFE